MSDRRDALSIAADVRGGRRKAVEVCDEALQAVARVDPQVRAIVEVTAEHAKSTAKRVDDAVAAGRNPGPLAGVPIILKDNICTSFGHTTCSSKILSGFQAPYDATVVQRLEAAGGVIVAKANLDEFAMGSSTENSGLFVTRNPWNTDYVPGGSSGGSTVGVAAGMAPLAFGSDTGGSIRQPAGLCGIVGVKPTYGRVSRYGLIAFGSSLDQIGPLASNVSDAALALQITAGRDAHDSTSVDRPVDDYLAALQDDAVTRGAQSLRIGVPKEYFAAGLHPEVRAAVETALEQYRTLGARTVEVSLPHSPYSIAVYYLVATAECSSNLARFDGVHYGHRTGTHKGIFELYSGSRAEGFGAEVKRRIMLGTFALSTGYADQYYVRALKVRRLIKQDFDRAFEQVDVIACPTSPSPAFRLGEKSGDPLQMYLADIYTISANLAGIAGVSLPCGLSGGGLPIGLQLLAPAFGEARMLQAARAFERATDWHTRRPPVYAAAG